MSFLAVGLGATVLNADQVVTWRRGIPQMHDFLPRVYFEDTDMVGIFDL